MSTKIKYIFWSTERTVIRNDDSCAVISTHSFDLVLPS